MDNLFPTSRPPPRRERAHERRRTAVNVVRDELIRRGLPARRAARYARELQAHWEDVRDEGLTAGIIAQAAEAEADRRLGTSRELISAAVRQHCRESFGGRHPFIAYLAAPFTLAPLALIAFLLSVVLPLSVLFGEPDDNGDTTPPPQLTAQQERRAWNVMLGVYVFWHAWSYVVPAGLAVACHRRARRRTLSAGWAWAASAALALGAGLEKASLRWASGPRPINFAISFGGWPEPSIVAVALACAAVGAWVIGRDRRRPTPQVVR